MRVTARSRVRGLSLPPEWESGGGVLFGSCTFCLALTLTRSLVRSPSLCRRDSLRVFRCMGDTDGETEIKKKKCGSFQTNQIKRLRDIYIGRV